MRLAIGIFVFYLLTSPTFAATPCTVLAAKVDSKPPGPVFLSSYPTVTKAGPLKDTAFLYDNALAALALIGCGKPGQASRIDDAIVVALNHDRYWHDGRLRNAYLAGPVTDNPVKLPGWWDNAQNRWVEDQYQVGSDSGNMAWAMLALLALYRANHNPAMLDGAERIAVYLESSFSTVVPAGYTGGMFGDEPKPGRYLWKSTEHNIDLAVAFRALAAVTRNRHWLMRARAASAFVDAMWNRTCSCFAAGTGPDGRTRNPRLALDSQLWPLLALPRATTRYAGAVETAYNRLGVAGGFAYSDVKQGVWTEGTAQAALLMELSSRNKKTSALMRVVDRNRAPNGGYFATGGAAIPTGFGLDTNPNTPRLYYHLPHLAALAWAALAKQRFNPFTAARALPQ